MNMANNSRPIKCIGVVTYWDDAKGYGYIRAEIPKADGTVEKFPDLPVHWSSIMSGFQSLQVNQRVTMTVRWREGMATAEEVNFIKVEGL